MKGFKMQFNVDKRFIEILNTLGVKITWEQFRKANDSRRAERDSDPAAVAHKELARRQEEVEMAAFMAVIR
jgi:hypothetical protein